MGTCSNWPRYKNSYKNWHSKYFKRDELPRPDTKCMLCPYHFPKATCIVPQFSNRGICWPGCRSQVTQLSSLMFSNMRVSCMSVHTLAACLTPSNTQLPQVLQALSSVHDQGHWPCCPRCWFFINTSASAPRTQTSELKLRFLHNWTIQTDDYKKALLCAAKQQL